jgi:thiol-disulfide isomerase/thioredoxin
MTDETTQNPASTPPSRGRASLVIGALAVVIGGAVLYGIGGFPGKEAGGGQCAAAKAIAERVAPLAKGEIAGMTIAKQPKPMAELAFVAEGGMPKKLSDFRGKTVLLNLWATWCVPCREEMPALDRLQEKLGGETFEVVAISIDTTRLERRKTFLSEAGVKSLGFYADPTAEVFQVLKKAGKVVGLPTTILVDSDGCELGLMPGAANWGAEDAVRMIGAARGGV